MGPGPPERTEKLSMFVCAARLRPWGRLLLVAILASPVSALAQARDGGVEGMPDAGSLPAGLQAGAPASPEAGVGGPDADGGTAAALSPDAPSGDLHAGGPASPEAEGTGSGAAEVAAAPDQAPPPAAGHSLEALDEGQTHPRAIEEFRSRVTPRPAGGHRERWPRRAARARGRERHRGDARRD